MLLPLISLLFLLTSASRADGQVYFKTTNSNFDLRSSVVGTYSIANLWNGIYWHSTQISGDNNTLDADYIWGNVVVHLGTYPCNWVAYFSADVNTHRNIPNPGSFNWNNFTVDTSSSFIASGYLSLNEKNPAGETVKTVAFNNILFPWVYNKDESDKLSNKNEGLIVSVFDLTHLNDAESIRLIYIFSTKGGVIGGLATEPTVIPKAVESIFQVKGWKYASPQNNLELNIAVASGESSFSADGSFRSGSGAKAAFFRVAKQVAADGVLVDIEISSEVSKQGAGVFDNAYLAFQLLSRYQESTSARIISIQFPANASNIEYDPMTGSGDDPFDGTGLSAGLVVLIVFAVAILVLGISLSLYMFYKRSDGYDTVR